MPFFKKGKMRPIFCDPGNSPSLRQEIAISRRKVFALSVRCAKNSYGMSSIPAALSLGKEAKTHSSSCHSKSPLYSSFAM